MTVTSISGIRGVVGSDLTVKDYAKVGWSFGEYIQGGVCAIGRDTRSSGKMMSDAAVSGLLSRGCTVFDLGVTSTPAVFREVLKGDLDGGLSVTASHNPPEWNGMKFVVKGGRGLFEEELNRLLKISSSPAAGSFRFGSAYPVEARYPSDIVTYVGEGCCSGLKVALDLGGGAGALFVPRVFKELGCRVLTVNASPGVFSRGMDPTRDGLKDLSEAVKTNSADIGVAYDCDADRVVFVDEDGEKLPADYALLIYLKSLADSDGMKDVVVSVDTTLAVEDIVREAGNRVVYSKVGEANVVRRMLEESIFIGGEGSSGGLIISDFNLCRDGVLASVLVAKVVKQKGGLKHVIEGLPNYHSLREKIECRREDALQVVKTLADDEAVDVDVTDGVKIRLRDRSWVLVRPSGTEDIVRISVEAETDGEASELMGRYTGKISKILQEIGQG